MMKYKGTAIPKTPDIGVSYAHVIDKAVPSQSMTLLEILERFTRGEKLPIGKEGNYHDGPHDLEKLAHADLVDRGDFITEMRETQNAYKKQERKKQRDAIEAEKAAAKAAALAELKAEENSAKAK